MVKSLGIVGLGLIGGSLAEAVRAHWPNARVLGADKDSNTLQEAHESGLFHELSTAPNKSWEQLDLIVISVPLGGFEAVVRQLKAVVSPQARITDVIGVKTPVMDIANRILGKDHNFVGCHPMAGGIVPGFSHRKAELFKGFPVAVCGDKNSTNAAEVFSFWQSLGGVPLYMSPNEHDREVAFTSHLPYLSSVVLREFAEEDTTALELQGPGFQRATRYAEFLPEIMGPVVAQNPHVPSLLRAFAKRFLDMADVVDANPDELVKQLTR